MDSQGRDVGDFVQACRHIVQVAVGYAATVQGSATRVDRCIWLGKGHIGAVVNRYRGWLSAYIGVNLLIITPL